MEPHVYESGSGVDPFVSAEPVATTEGPGRRRDSWSLKTIVEDVGGRPLADFQDPDRPNHPYTQWRLDAAAAAAARTAAAPPEEPTDPVGRVYPPLVGPTGRSLHGKDAEHHPATLATVASDPVRSVGHPSHAPGPSHRPERIYLHYLLLHLDRLNDAALAYLSQAVVEEMGHRAAPAGTPVGGTAAPELSSRPAASEGEAPTRARTSVQT
jgi:hypothetical protein